MVKPVTVFIADDEEIEGIKLRPLAAALGTTAPPAVEGGTSNATATATYQAPTNDADANADITYDL